MRTNQRGITLVALVITIVIIIILATVTINMAFGDNGLIKQAELARDMAANSTQYETESMANLTAYLNEVMNEDTEIPLPDPTNEVDPGPIDPPGPTLPEGWDGNKVTPEESDDGVIVPVPDGFEPSEEDGTHNVNDGFVITDGTNEFVWIPVNSEQLAKMYTETDDTPLSAYDGVDATTTAYGNLRNSDGSGASEGGIPGSTTYREPDILTSTTYGDASTTADRGINLIKEVFGFEETNGSILDQFAEMLVANYEEAYQSIKKYGGFYIGRYELTGSVTAPTVQKYGTVVTGTNWYELYDACSNVVENSDSAKTTMIAGTQWDRVLEWLVETGMEPSDVYDDSSSWGNYSNYNTANGYSEGNPEYEATAGSKQSAGSSEYWQANNIYDLAGNCYEWTQEALSTNDRVNRGGYYVNSGSSNPASDRSDNVPYYSFSNGSSRPVLYVAL